MRAAAAHEVPLDRALVRPVLAEELLRPELGDEASRPRRPRRRRPFGHASRYSKKPAPAPFCLRPSIAVHVPHAPARVARAVAAPRAARAACARRRRSVSSRGEAPSPTTKVVKLRCSTRPAASSSVARSTATARAGGHRHRDRLERPRQSTARRRPCARRVHHSRKRPRSSWPTSSSRSAQLGARRGVGQERGPQRHRHASRPASPRVAG